MRDADPDFQRRVSTGLTSGEGVIRALRDPKTVTRGPLTSGC